MCGNATVTLVVCVSTLCIQCRECGEQDHVACHEHLPHVFRHVSAHASV